MTTEQRILIGSVALAVVVLTHLSGGVRWFDGVDRGAAAILAVLGVYYLLLGWSALSVFARAALALVPVGGLAVLLIVSIDRFAVLREMESRALIAAIVVAAGWVVGFVTAEMRRTATEQERRRDMIRATISEVELIRDHGLKNDWGLSIQQIKDAFQQDRRYRAFIFYGHSYLTLRRLVEQVEILEWRQITPVMDLFQLLDRLERMEARIHSEDFHKLPWDRRQTGLIRFLTLHGEVPDVADRALEVLRDGPFHGVLRKLR